MQNSTSSVTRRPPEIVALASDRIIVAGLQRDVRLVFRQREALCGSFAIWGRA